MLIYVMMKWNSSALEHKFIAHDDLMFEARCDQHIVDLFTEGFHHRNMSVIYLTQTFFPQENENVYIRH